MPLHQRLRPLALSAALLASGAPAVQAAPHLQGDVGAAVYRTPPVARTTDRATTVLPYVYADAGNWYGRVDTFGWKATPIGRGHLELALRVSFERYRPANAAFGERSTPVPVGLGSFQETGWGAFIVYAFADPVSKGTLLDASYAAQLGSGRWHVYPQVGVERRSARYVQHLYGVSPAEALRSGSPGYAPGASLTPNAALAVDYELSPDWKLTAQVRRRWLDKSITDSPLVDTKTQTSSLLAVTRTFR